MKFVGCFFLFFMIALAKERGRTTEVPRQGPHCGTNSGRDGECSVLWSQLGSSCAVECYTRHSIST